MSKRTTTKELHLSDPQQELEKILTAEISVAQKVSEAREKADKSIAAAQSNQAHIKEQIMADARAQRDKAFKEGVEAAREASKKSIASAQVEAEKNTVYGRQFLDEAVDYAMDFLIGQNQEQL